MNSATVIADTPRSLDIRHDCGTAFRIGVVGCGPRGLHCLQSLADRLRRCRFNRRVSVTIYEPCENLGAGNVYNPQQPKYLRMNFAAKHINAWPPTTDDVGVRLNLVDWVRKQGNASIGPNDFVARAVVGNYLSGCFSQVLDDLRQLVEVRVCQTHIDAIETQRENAKPWRIRADNMVFDFDEVVLAVGPRRMATLRKR